MSSSSAVVLFLHCLSPSSLIELFYTLYLGFATAPSLGAGLGIGYCNAHKVHSVSTPLPCSGSPISTPLVPSIPVSRIRVHFISGSSSLDTAIGMEYGSAHEVHSTALSRVSNVYIVSSYLLRHQGLYLL